MRYFAKLSYNGKNYCGWQRQPDAPSVQETLEKSFSTILRTAVEIVGCGRTDTGVHARQYFLHFDIDTALLPSFLLRINKYLPPDIAIKKIFEVEDKLHARFDANFRAYEYHIDFHKNPFETDTVFHFPFAKDLDFDKMQTAAKLLMEFESFYPFCKSKTDVKTMDCKLYRSEWEYQEDRERLIFYIAANRFLRGMVRLIVGMCLNVGLGKVKMEDVEKALQHQERLKKSWSVPPHGLFLTEIKYSGLTSNGAVVST